MAQRLELKDQIRDLERTEFLVNSVQGYAKVQKLDQLKAQLASVDGKLVGIGPAYARCCATTPLLLAQK